MAFISQLSWRLPTPLVPASRGAPKRAFASARTQRVTMQAASAVESAWTEFAAKMKEAGESPAVEEWNNLVQVCADEKDFERGVWVLNTMRDTGRAPTAVTYESLLELCIETGNKAHTFVLVELMYKDRVSLGDVTLPEDVEKTLRAVLPADAF